MSHTSEMLNGKVRTSMRNVTSGSVGRTEVQVVKMGDYFLDEPVTQVLVELAREVGIRQQSLQIDDFKQ